MVVTVCASETETAALLEAVLDGDSTAAALLAKAIHQDPAAVDNTLQNTGDLSIPHSPSELGIWIDPIGKMLSVHLPVFLLVCGFFV